MDPVTNKILQGVPFAGMGTTLERNALIGVIRNLISQDRYNVDYILNYAESVGYSRQDAEDVFKELTGLSPRLIVNNNEYYKMPSYVPNMCIAWGISKSTKNKAYYLTPFEYGYAVMEKDEVNAPIPTIICATIPEAFDELKKVAKNIQTLDKIITKKLLETEEVPTDAKNPHQVNLPYTASPLQVLKKNFKDRVLSASEFERQASKLLQAEEITVDEAEDLMNWKQELVDEDESYANEVLETNEKWNEVQATMDFEDVYNEVDAMVGEDNDFVGNKSTAKELFETNKSLFRNIDLQEAADRLYQLLLGFSVDEIKGHSKFEKKESSKVCPNCGSEIKGYPALSRKDNKTEICSQCGQLEALEDFYNYNKKKSSINCKADKNEPFYDVRGLNNIEMEITSYGNTNGLEIFELDGIEFYKADDEELENAVDICIEEEFAPEWEEQGLFDYTIDHIDYDEEDGQGTAYVNLTWEDKIQASKKLIADKEQEDYNKAFIAIQRSRIKPNTSLRGNLLYSLFEEMDIDMDSLTDEEFEYWKNLLEQAKSNMSKSASKYDDAEHIIKELEDRGNISKETLDLLKDNLQTRKTIDKKQKTYQDKVKKQQEKDMQDFLDALRKHKSASKKVTTYTQSDINKLIKDAKIYELEDLLANEKITRQDDELFDKVINLVVTKLGEKRYDGGLICSLLTQKIITEQDGELFKKAIKKVVELDHEGYWSYNLLKDGIITEQDGELFKKAVDHILDKKYSGIISNELYYIYNLLKDGIITEQDGKLFDKAVNLALRFFGINNLLKDGIITEQDIKSFNKKSASKKVTAENMTLEDIEAEDSKDQVQEEIKKIDETPVEEIFSETTPEQYFEKSLSEDKVDTINDVVSKCIDKFSEKFKDFDKYTIKVLSYNTKVLGDYKANTEEMVEDKEINANAILQVILSINNNADDTNIKKVLAVFSITNGQLHWTGTVRGENDQVVAFTEEGLDALFEVDEPSEEELEDII